MCGHGPRDPDQPPSTERQVGDRAVQVVLEPELPDRRHRRGVKWWIRRPHESGQPRGPVALVRRGTQVLEHGQVLEELERLERSRHPGVRPAVRGQAPDARVAEHDLSSVDPREAGDRVDRGGLARAVGADQADDLTRPDLE